MKLVILDYSGTLSLSSVLFATPERLMRELERCGLKRLGITTCDMFWDAVVNPTWQEGSTTRAGYKEIMKRTLRKTFHLDASEVSPVAESFVDAYMAESRIDPSWKPVLEKLSSRPGVKTIIASDHYPEATDEILASLADLGFRAVAFREHDWRIRDVSFIAANSADIGFHKADQRFWEAVKVRILPEKAVEVLIVDDFGANEPAGSSYAEREKVSKRIQETEYILKKVFQTDIEIFSFILEGGCSEDSSLYRSLVDEVSRKIEHYLA